jgi:protein neuralized
MYRLNNSMGNTLLDSTSSDDSFDTNTTSIAFHDVCGSQIKFNSIKTRAKRIDGYCKAIVFTNRRIRPYEIVNINIKQTTSRWNGCIRIGFTSESLNNTRVDIQRTRYACPDLTNKSGFWARGVQETLSVNDKVSFYFDTNGNMFYFVNNNAKKQLLTNEIDLNKTKLLYALIDIYGSVTEIELLGTYSNANNEITHLVAK